MLAALELGAGKITSVKFEQTGPSRLDEEMLLMNIQSKKGTSYSASVLNEDIKRLLATGYFDDANARETSGGDGSSEIVFTLKLKPRLKAVIIEGNAKFKTKELLEEVTLTAGGPLNEAKFRESARKLREFYRGKGYNQATVTPKYVDADGSGSAVNAVFVIVENLREKVDRVTFEGNTVYKAGDLKSAMANRHSFLSRFFELGLYDAKELEMDKLRLRELYFDRGYLDFNVDKITVTPQKDDPEYVDLHLVLSEGEPYTVGEIKINGAKEIPAEELAKFIRMESGRVFSSGEENAARRALENMYSSRGYTDFSCQVERSADYASHKVDLTFNIFEGRKHYVHDIIIKGNTATKDKVIRRELAVQPGDPVDKNRLEASKSRLMGMGYFKNVDINTVNADKLDEKNVEIKIEEKRDFLNFKIGGGFSDVNNLVGMIEASSSNFDIADPGNWFYGGGQRIRLRGMAGIDTYGFNFDFSDPWFLDRRLRFDLSAYWNEIEYDHWTEERIGVRAAFTRRVFDAFTNATLGYKFERVKVKDMSRDESWEMRSEQGWEWVSQFSGMIERDTRDSLVEPTRGYSVSVLGAISPRVAGSSSNFYRLEAKGSYFYSIFDKAVIFMLSGKIGTVSDFNRDDTVPIFERYFLGGGDSLRGFPYREVSPVDSNGHNIGGQSMLLVTGEVTHPIWNFIRGAAFVDVGNVWANSYCFTLNKINIGVGYGLRIKVPYINAPIRLDLAYPVLSNQDDLSKKLRFHFNMGFTVGH